MKYLLDTHILIWLCVSTVSLWEIAIKLSVGKLDLRGIDLPDIADMCAEQGIEIVQFPVSAALQYRRLPLKENHKDPFDRALISLCIAESYTFLSADAKLAQYEPDGLRVIS